MKSKRTLIAVILAFTMLFSMMCSAAPTHVIMEDANEVATADVAEVQDAAEIMSGEIVPGKNILTNTTGAYTFDNGLGTVSSLDEVPELFEDGGNTVVKVSHANYQGAHNNINLWTGSIDRPVYFSVDIKAVVAGSNDFRFYGKDSSNGNLKEHVMKTSVDNGWVNVEFMIEGVSSTRPLTQIKSFAAHTAGAWTDYYDNLIVMPAYKVTYHNADGSETVEYVDPRETTFAPEGSWATVAGEAPQSEIELNYEDIDLYPAVAEIVPGKNILTNTTGAYTFDNGLGTVSSLDEVPELFEDGGNTVVKVSHANYQGAHNNINLWTGSIDRPVYFSVDIKAVVAGSNDFRFYGKDSSNGNLKEHVMKTSVDNGWVDVGFMIEGVSSTRPLTQIKSFAAHTAGAWTDYYDNLIVMPAYKVTYHNADGSETVEYVDPRETTFAPEGSWTTTEGGTEAVPSVTLAYEDIDLYPAVIVPGKNILTGTTEAYTFDGGVHSLMTGDGLKKSTDGENAVAQISHAGYAGTHDIMTVWEGSLDRPAYVSVQFKTTVAPINNYLLYRGISSNGSVEQESAKTPSDSWKELGQWIKLEAYLNNHTADNPLTKIAIHADHTAGAWTDYVDDVVVIPAYKVTYYDANGDVLETVYADPRYDYKVKTDNVIAGTSGWATVAGEAPQSVIELNYEDIELYPACEHLHSTNGASIRADVVGIRFRGGITESFKAQPEVVAYGHIVTTEKHLANPEDLAFGIDAKYVYGVSYDVNTGRDAIYEIDDKYVYFTSVLVGMDLTKTVCETKYIVRPYVLMSDGSYVYGTPVSRSMLETANNIIASDNATEDEIATAQRIIDACK